MRRPLGAEASIGQTRASPPLRAGETREALLESVDPLPRQGAHRDRATGKLGVLLAKRGETVFRGGEVVLVPSDDVAHLARLELPNELAVSRDEPTLAVHHEHRRVAAREH